jgi:hypothetical protein
MNLIDCKKFKYFIYAFFITVISIILTYYSFGIYVLVNDYDRFKTVEALCDTKIWYYVLTCLIVNSDKLLFRKYYSKEENIRLHISITLLEGMMLTFGGLELFRNDQCIKDNDNSFFNTGLWKFALVNFIIQMVTTLIFSANVITYLCKKKNNVMPIGENEFEDINEFDDIQRVSDEDRFTNISIV